MSEKDQRSWENFLNPAVLRPNLIVASIYIAAFQLLKNAIVDRLRFFYTFGFDENATPTGRKYQSEVLARNRSPVYASLDWLKESQAIDSDDLAAFEKVKKLRNDLAHELTQMLRNGLPSDLPERFNEMVSLLDKIERWWIVNVEIPTNPEFDDKKLDAEKVIPGPLLGLRLLVDVALGSEEESRKYVDEFRRRANQLGSENPS